MAETSVGELFAGQEQLQALIERVKRAQIKFSTYTQEQVDTIFRAAAIAANDERIKLAAMAVEETGMSSRTTSQPSTSSTSTRTRKPVV